MVKLERQKVREDIDNEGFDYAFQNYSDYRDIEDEEFHRLRLAYLAARKALEDYIG